MRYGILHSEIMTIKLAHKNFTISTLSPLTVSIGGKIVEKKNVVSENHVNTLWGTVRGELDKSINVCYDNKGSYIIV